MLFEKFDESHFLGVETKVACIRNRADGYLSRWCVRRWWCSGFRGPFVPIFGFPLLASFRSLFVLVFVFFFLFVVVFPAFSSPFFGFFNEFDEFPDIGPKQAGPTVEMIPHRPNQHGFPLLNEPPDLSEPVNVSQPRYRDNRNLASFFARLPFPRVVDKPCIRQVSSGTADLVFTLASTEDVADKTDGGDVPVGPELAGNIHSKLVRDLDVFTARKQGFLGNKAGSHDKS